MKSVPIRFIRPIRVQLPPANQTTDKPEMLLQIISIIGALCILFPFAALQAGWLRQSDISYLLLNMIGSFSLLVVAVIDERHGFILLEGAWGLVSLWGLIRVIRRRRSAET